MKALILTMQCGECHNTVAKSVRDSLATNNIDSKIVDIFASNPKLLKWNDKANFFAKKYFPKIFNVIWNGERKRNPNRRFKGTGYIQIKKVLTPILNTIKEYNPDFIVCTHNYASSIVSTLFYQNKLKHIPTFSFLLDYVVHPYWEDSILIDKVFTPHLLTHDALISKGFKETQLEATGFPVHEKFNTPIDKNEARKILDLKNKFTILSLGGGENQLNQIGLLKQLTKCNNFDESQIIFVCGKNKKNKLKLEKFVEKHHLTNIIVLGFVNTIKELICASDIVIASAGGGTISEVLSLNTPLIIREKTTTNETFNKNALIENDVALGLDKLKDVKKVLSLLIDNPNKIKSMQENIQVFYYKNGLKNAVDEMLKIMKKKTTK